MTDFDVVFIDDDKEVLEAYAQTLELEGFSVRPCRTAASGIEKLTAETGAVVVTDVRMPQRDGFQALAAIRQIDPDIPVIMVTGHGDIPMALKALRAGAWDFIEKPADPALLVEAVRRAQAHRKVILENRGLRALTNDVSSWEGRVIGRSPAVARMRQQLQMLSDVDVDVLILGETGTGKEVAARALHDLGSRRDGRFVAVNCGAIPETMLESELFGHEQGAFTGAQARRIGKIEHADGGTLFFDEIESMPLAAQVRLLRVLQERTIERLGSNTERQVNLRIVTATKVDLNKLAAEGRFREDLAYRLDIARVEIPPLRQRGRDIVLLFGHFLDLAARRQGRATPVADAATIEQLMAHDWPGNVRELRNAAERFVLGMGLPNPAQPAAAAGDPDDLLEQKLNRAERAIIIDALASHEGRMGETAEALGISRKTLYLKMRKLEIAARPEDEAG